MSINDDALAEPCISPKMDNQKVSIFTDNIAGFDKLIKTRIKVDWLVGCFRISTLAGYSIPFYCSHTHTHALTYIY